MAYYITSIKEESRVLISYLSTAVLIMVVYTASIGQSKANLSPAEAMIDLYTY